VKSTPSNSIDTKINVPNLETPTTVDSLPRSTMKSPKPQISQGALDKFSYLELVEMHNDLEEWMEVWESRLEQIQEEIKKRIEDRFSKK